MQFRSGGVKSRCSKGFSLFGVLKHRGFTLAEVLITLAIVGVVAAMTLPILVGKYQKMVAVNKLKRTYNVLANSINSMLVEETGGSMSNATFVMQKYNHKNCFDPVTFESVFSPYIKHLSVEPCAGTKMCLPENTDIKYYQKSVWGIKEIDNWNEYKPWFKWRLPDGSVVNLVHIDKNWTWIKDDGTAQSRVVFIVDIDGEQKGYNMLGKDTFFFELLPNGTLTSYNSANKNTCTTKDFNKSLNMQCTEKIVKDGWQMKSDYPW